MNFLNYELGFENLLGEAINNLDKDGLQIFLLYVKAKAEEALEDM